MRQSANKKTNTVRESKKLVVDARLDPLRSGMPALDSITGVDVYRKRKKLLHIIHTNEVDAYERGPLKAKGKRHMR